MSDKTASSLPQVRFYTALDPYFYTTDNRPLEDLAQRDIKLAEAIDLVTGGSERSSMAAASVAHALLGANGYVGAYTLPGGLSLRFQYGFAVRMLTDAVNPALIYPKMGVHDSVTTISNMVAAVTPGRAIKYLIQAIFEEATPNSRIPADRSGTMVCRLAAKASAEYVNDGQSTPTIAPDANALGLMEVVIPYGKTILAQSDIKRLSFTDVNTISQIVANGPITAASMIVKSNRYEVALPAGARHIPLAGSGIVPVANANNIDVYITGLFQHNFTVDIPNNRISLGGNLPDAAEVLIVQRVTVKA